MATLSNTRNLIAACAAITVFGFAFGMTYPLLSLILEARGVSADMIGINSAMMPIGILLFSSVIPVAARRFGARKVAIAAALVTAATIISYKLFDSLTAWFVIRLIQGMSSAVLFVLSEAWIVGFAGSQHRGKIVAIYSSVLSASFGAGPALVGWLGIEGWAPFVIGSLTILAGIIPLSLVQEKHTRQPEESGGSGFLAFAPKAPVLLAAVGVFSIFDAATLSLLPVYGILNGLSTQTAATALTFLIVGNIVFQFPLGWLADRYSHRILLASCALTATVGLLMLPALVGTPWMWPLLIVVGTTGYGVYTISLTSLGNRFQGQELVQGSAAFAVMWGTGALLGSVSGGWSISLFGANGLPVYLAVVYLLLVAGLAVRGRYAGNADK